jgi:hypothetical protein
MASNKLILTYDILENGICIDFEQRKNDKTPAMIGVYEDKAYRCYILDDELTRVSYVKANGKRDTVAFLEALLNRAIADGRFLVAFSEHEKNIISAILPHRADDVDGQYINVNVIARGFFNRKRRRTMKLLRASKLAETNGYTSKIGLKDYLGLDYVRFRYPEDLKSNFRGAGTVLGMVRKQLAKKRRFKHMTKLAQEQWKQLIEYNRHDCRGAMHLLRYVLRRSRGSVAV